MGWFSLYSLQLITAHPPFGPLEVNLGTDNLGILGRVSLNRNHFRHIEKLIHQGLQNISRFCTSCVLRCEIHIIEYAPKLSFAAQSEDVALVQCRDHRTFLIGLQIDLGLIRDDNEFFPGRKDQR